MKVSCTKCLDSIDFSDEEEIIEMCSCENILVKIDEDTYEFGWKEGQGDDNLKIHDDMGNLLTLAEFKALLNEDAGEA